MNLYFGIDDIGLNGEVGQWLAIAAGTALANSGLRVNCIYPGEGHLLIEKIANSGVNIIQRETRIKDHIIEANARMGFPLHAQGAYLRYEIASIDDNKYSIYADCDVLFKKKFQLPDELPSLVAACREASPSEDFNSGVLIFNNKSFREQTDDFLRYCYSHFGTWTVGVDQRPFNDFFKGRISRLPDTLNWRPKSGVNQNAAAIHFHGTKIGELNALSSGQIPASLINEYLIERASNSGKDIESTKYYLDYFAPYLGPPEKHQISCAAMDLSSFCR